MMLNTVAQSAPAPVITLDSRRPRQRRTPRHVIKIAAVFGICVLGLIGSFADSAVARSGLLLIGSADDAGGSHLNIAMTLIWATIANVAACAGVVVIVCCLLARPSAQVVELRPRRYKR